MNDKFIDLDFRILDFIHDTFSNAVLDGIMPAITRLGNAALIWILIAVFLLIISKYRRYGIILSVALILCLLIGNITLKPLVARVRPYDLRPGIDLLIAKETDYSFPSGHAMSSFAAATVLLHMNKKVGIAALLLAFLIAFSRLYLYVHFPSDVLAGMVLGIAIGLISVKRLEKADFSSVGKKSKRG